MKVVAIEDCYIGDIFRRQGVIFDYPGDPKEVVEGGPVQPLDGFRTDPPEEEPEEEPDVEEQESQPAPKATRKKAPVRKKGQRRGNAKA